MNTTKDSTGDCCPPPPCSATEETAKLLTALETAIAEEAHFYRGEIDSRYWVKLFRGPSFCGETIKETLALLAAHYAESQNGLHERPGATTQKNTNAK